MTQQSSGRWPHSVRTPVSYINHLRRTSHNKMQLYSAVILQKDRSGCSLAKTPKRSYGLMVGERWNNMRVTFRYKIAARRYYLYLF